MSRNLIFIFILFFFSLQDYAQTVTWSTPPMYKSLEEYAGMLYKIKEKGKVGLVDISGKVLVSASYDSITPFIEHLALALEYDGGKYAVRGIINQKNYNMIKVNDTYYITDDYPFFSEGKLVVCDSNSKYGYMQADGSLFKNCQYIRAYPFYNGRACIQLGEKKIKYLKNTGEELTTQLESNTFTLLSGTSFNEKGEAFVQGEATGKGVKRWIIDSDGKNIREAKLSGRSLKNYTPRGKYFQSTMQSSDIPLDGVNPLSQNGLYGFSDTNNTIVLSAQFTEAFPFRGGYAKVKKEDKYGILQLQSGSFHGQFDKSNSKVENGKAESVAYSVSIPSVYADKVMTMQMNQENSPSQVLQPIASDNNNKTYSFRPEPQNKEKEICYHFSMQADGLKLWEDTQNISLQYVVQPILFLSVPQIGTNFKTDDDGYVRADNQNKIDLFATVENRSTEAISITISIYGNEVERESRTLAIEAGSHARIATSINQIKERKQVEVTVETSTGLRKSSNIKIKPFI